MIWFSEKFWLILAGMWIVGGVICLLIIYNDTQDNHLDLQTYMEQPAIFMTTVSGPNGSVIIKTEEMTLRECSGLAALHVMTGNNIFPGDESYVHQNTENELHVAYNENFSVAFCFLPDYRGTYQMFKESITNE